MKKFSSLVFVICIVAVSQNAYAQRGYVERAIEKSYEKKYGDPGKEKGNDWLNNKLLNVNVQPQYTFTKSITMHSTQYKNGVIKNETDMTYYLMAKDPIIGITIKESEQNNSNKRKKKVDDMFSIYDSKANAMIMLNRNNKTGTAINYNAFMSKANIEKRNQGTAKNQNAKNDNDCKRTGKTKTIRGVICEQMICVNLETETKSEFWVNTKAGPMAGQTQMKGHFGGMGYNSNVQGLIMEGNFYRNNELESKIETTEVNNNANYIINTTEYKIN